MKNKKLTILLIVAVAGVWGVIFYRIFNNSQDKPVPLVASTTTDVTEGKFSASTDTFTLALNYRDPFLDKAPVEAETAPLRISRAEPVAVEVRKEAGPDWNFIKYNGFILNPGNRKKVSILTVNGKEQMLDEGDEINGVKLMRNYGDSIKVSFQGRTKFILLQ